MDRDQSDTGIPQGQLWITRNYERIKLITGAHTILAFALTLGHGGFVGSVLLGFIGAYLLGGWPTIRRLLRSPTWQLRQWYYILIDARQYTHFHSDDDSVEVVEMKPKPWGWTSTRWYDERKI